MKLAKQFKDQGNEEFKKGDIEAALKEYERAVEYIEFVKEPEVPALEAVLRCNLSLIAMKNKNVKLAIDHALKATQADSKNIKAFFRLAMAYYENAEFKSSYETAKKGIDLDPHNKDLRELYKKSFEQYRGEIDKEKAMYKMMFTKKDIYDPVVTVEYHNASNPVVFLSI